jgi:hypothetical protein
MLDRRKFDAAARRLMQDPRPATLRVRSSAYDETDGWTYTDYELSRVHDGGETKLYAPAGQPDADADTNRFVLLASDLEAAGAPAPRRHDLIVWSEDGKTYVINTITDTGFGAVYLCDCHRAGPGGAP